MNIRFQEIWEKNFVKNIILNSKNVARRLVKAFKLSIEVLQKNTWINNNNNNKNKNSES